MYEYADLVINYLNSQFIEKFSKLKSTIATDELNILQTVKTMFAEMDELVREWLYHLAVVAYENVSNGDVSGITEQWLLDEVLERVDPVTKYIYSSEVERKCSRLYESLMLGWDSVEIDKSLRYWSLMVEQMAISTVDAATLQAYEDMGVLKVIWRAEIDGRECSICHKRDGKVYSMEELPPKPHIGCRCFFEPA